MVGPVENKGGVVSGKMDAVVAVIEMQRSCHGAN